MQLQPGISTMKLSWTWLVNEHNGSCSVANGAQMQQSDMVNICPFDRHDQIVLDNSNNSWNARNLGGVSLLKIKFNLLNPTPLLNFFLNLSYEQFLATEKIDNFKLCNEKHGTSTKCRQLTRLQ